MKYKSKTEEKTKFLEKKLLLITLVYSGNKLIRTYAYKFLDNLK